MISGYPSPIDDLFIGFCDRDANWGPLLFLRPTRRERIAFSRTLAGAVLLGLPLGLLGTVLTALLAWTLGEQPPQVLWFPVVLTALYCAVAQLTLVRSWNRRAARLARWS